jgi:hypothetical protein
MSIVTGLQLVQQLAEMLHIFFAALWTERRIIVSIVSDHRLDPVILNEMQIVF